MAKSAGREPCNTCVISRMRRVCIPVWLVIVCLRKRVHVKSGRPAWIDRWKQRRAGVRVIIVVKKRGNSRGAKGGRKAKADERERCHTVGTRLPDRARTPEAKSPHLNWKLLADVTERQASGGESASPYTATSVLTMRQLADWRAVCGRSARPVRREGRRNPMRRSYPYLPPPVLLFGHTPSRRALELRCDARLSAWRLVECRTWCRTIRTT